jgi:hypothetical protein
MPTYIMDFDDYEVCWKFMYVYNIPYIMQKYELCPWSSGDVHQTSAGFCSAAPKRPIN